jgi:hypothetical protein
MVLYDSMLPRDRIDQYRKRGFLESEAEVLMLMEEAALGLFSAFPDRFILIGGAALVLFYASPRLSRDLDLLALARPLPDIQDVAAAVRSRIEPLAEIFGLGRIEFRSGTAGPDFVKRWVLADQKVLFSVDLTTIGGGALESQIVKRGFADRPEGTVLTPNANYLLLQKCETFLGRRHVKSKDAFDIQLLILRGAELGQALRPHWKISWQ